MLNLKMRWCVGDIMKSIEKNIKTFRYCVTNTWMLAGGSDDWDSLLVLDFSTKFRAFPCRSVVYFAKLITESVENSQLRLADHQISSFPARRRNQRPQRWTKGALASVVIPDDATTCIRSTPSTPRFGRMQPTQIKSIRCIPNVPMNY